MRIEQADIAHLRDDEVRRLVLELVDSVSELDAAEHGGSRAAALPDFWRRFAVAVVRVLRERRGMFAATEFLHDNDLDAEGALVEPGSDPVADALDDLRRAARGELDALGPFLPADDADPE